MSEKFLIIGSNSFSGADFVDLLLEKFSNKVIGISRSNEKSRIFLPYLDNPNRGNFQFHALDLNRDLKSILELIDQERPNVIINFAAQSEVVPSWDYPEHWYQTNIMALGLLAQALSKRKFLRRFVQISSPEVYGTCSGLVFENAHLNPSTPYAASKAGGDLALLPYFKNFGFPLVTVRATNVYGAHQQLFKIIPRSFIFL